MELVSALAEGGGYKAAAARLEISPLTVATHLHNIKEKLRKVVDPDEHAISVQDSYGVQATWPLDIGDSAGLVFYCLHKGWIE